MEDPYLHLPRAEDDEGVEDNEWVEDDEGAGEDDGREWLHQIAQNEPTFQIFAIYGVGANVLLRFGHALTRNTHLRQLRLRDVVLTEEAAHALAQGMAQSKIEVLHLEGDCQESPSLESSPQGQGHNIRNIFYRGIQASNNIQHLYLNQPLTNDPGDVWRDVLLGLTVITFILSRNHSDSYIQACFHVLSRTTVLRELTVDLGGVKPDEVATLVHSLRQNTSVTTLRLESDNFSTLSNTQLLCAQGPNPNSSITKLSVCSSNIDDGCIELLLDRWLPNCSLEELILFYNNIGPTGALHLMQMIAAHYPTMSKLSLSFNRNIGYEGLRMIGNELPNLHHLTHLDLSCCVWIEDAQPQTRARQQAGQALLDGIKHNLSVTALEMIGNSFPVNVKDEIEFYCALNKMGRYLLSYANDEDHGVAASAWSNTAKTNKGSLANPEMQLPQFGYYGAVDEGDDEKEEGKDKAAAGDGGDDQQQPHHLVKRRVALVIGFVGSRYHGFPIHNNQRYKPCWNMPCTEPSIFHRPISVCRLNMDGVTVLVPIVVFMPPHKYVPANCKCHNNNYQNNNHRWRHRQQHRQRTTVIAILQHQQRTTVMVILLHQYRNKNQNNQSRAAQETMMITTTMMMVCMIQ